MDSESHQFVRLVTKGFGSNGQTLRLACQRLGKWEFPSLRMMCELEWEIPTNAILGPRWWFQTFVIFTPKIGEDSHFD